ncbi:MAG: NUDIX hydrolase [Planctomycetota bacterium]
MHQLLLSTPRFNVERRVFAGADGGSFTREVVVHPGAVVILPIIDPGRIVMIRNFRYTIEQELWELPAGTAEPDEAAIETARRELEEESGYRAGTMTPLTEFFTSPGVLTERMFAFVATDLKSVGQRLEHGERIIAEIVELDRARQWLVNGELRDGKTIAVLGTYFARL